MKLDVGLFDFVEVTHSIGQVGRYSNCAAKGVETSRCHHLTDCRTESPPWFGTVVPVNLP